MNPPDMRLQTEAAFACGIGEGANCCAYLMADGQGFCCGQNTTMAAAIRARVGAGDMHARRLPKGDFPDCQQEGRT